MLFLAKVIISLAFPGFARFLNYKQGNLVIHVRLKIWPNKNNMSYLQHFTSRNFSILLVDKIDGISFFSTPQTPETLKFN